MKLSSGNALTSKTAEAPASRDVSKSKAGAIASSSSAQGKQTFEFTETGIRQFITVQGGGRSTVKTILAQFKKQMKAIGPSAGEKLKEMLLKVHALSLQLVVRVFDDWFLYFCR